MHSEEEMVKTKLNSKTLKIIIPPLTPAYSHVISTVGVGGRSRIKGGRGLPHADPCLKTLQGSAAQPQPRHAPARAHSLSCQPRGEAPAGLRSDAAGHSAWETGKGREADGRGMSPARPRKPKPTKQWTTGNPRLPTARPRVPGRGPGGSSQPPPAPSSSR